MENAFWNGESLMAGEIAEDYEKEKEIRRASGHKELKCPDPECQHPIVRYCHGEKKDAYFAHLDNQSCDYAVFDRGNTQIVRGIKRLLFEHFKSQGYDMAMEVKVLPHHYTHLLLKKADGSQLAIELGTQRLSANKMAALTEAYQEAGIPVKWLVIGNTNVEVRENQTFFLKRYLLNESKNKDLLVISWDGSEIAQYKIDDKRYRDEGRIAAVMHFDKTFTAFGEIKELMIEEGELTLKGFKENYAAWLAEKQLAFNEQIKRKRAEEEKRQAQMLQQLARMSGKRKETVLHPVSSLPVRIKETDYRAAVLPLLSQQEEAVYDALGRRWLVCEECGTVETADHFTSYGGESHVNLGVCEACSKQ